ncbi:MAG TPA: tRNA 2-selenouridine(34) synthase MnmH [Anaerolineae bacterium]|nr:tRNA 2-selenouridine(34) synthase MnmH [Anaerolineae bacterium]
MNHPLIVEEFLKLGRQQPIIDVRTPAEFAKGHIPGAVNVPLFSNEERHNIGWTYKQIGREQAMLLGMEAAGPRMRALVEQVQAAAPGQTVLIHCWRGGMRSQSMAWLVGLFGYQTYTLVGGYKAFRHYVLAQFEQPRPILILSGKTGSGKTEILHELAARGEQVIDLEGLAHHKGSAFGALGEVPQPAQQQFENELAMQWADLQPQRPVWLEDESRHIGRLAIPEALWTQMRAASVLCLDVPLEQRVDYLMAEYGRFNRDDLRQAILCLTKRLGPQISQQALEALAEDDLATCCQLLLQSYYDKTYAYGLAQRQPASVQHLVADTLNPAANASHILAAAPHLRMP